MRQSSNLSTDKTISALINILPKVVTSKRNGIIGSELHFISFSFISTYFYTINLQLIKNILHNTQVCFNIKPILRKKKYNNTKDNLPGGRV